VAEALKQELSRFPELGVELSEPGACSALARRSLLSATDISSCEIVPGTIIPRQSAQGPAGRNLTI
jgi:hypothetical protein